MADQSAIERDLAKAKDHKDQGNAFFSSNDIEKAVFQYWSAIMVLKTRCSSGEAGGNPMVEGLMKQQGSAPEKPNAAQQKELNALYDTVRVNLAACLFKQKKYDRVIATCTDVIASDPTLVKAYFRRGSAYLETNSFDKAKDDFEKIKTLTTDESTLKSLVRPLQRVAVWEKQQDAKQRAAYANIFS